MDYLSTLPLWAFIVVCLFVALLVKRVVVRIISALLTVAFIAAACYVYFNAAG